MTRMNEEAAAGAADGRDVGTFVERSRALRSCGRANETAERSDGRGFA